MHKKIILYTTYLCNRPSSIYMLIFVEYNNSALQTVPMGERNVHPDGEKVPGDELKNKCENNTGESLLSHTMVSSSEIHRVDPDKTLAPVGQYTDFAVGVRSLVYFIYTLLLYARSILYAKHLCPTPMP